MSGKIFVHADEQGDRVALAAYRDKLIITGSKYNLIGDLVMQTWNRLSREQAMDLRNAIDVWISAREAQDG